MPVPQPGSASDNVLNVPIANITAATVAYTAVTKAGRIKAMHIVPQAVTATGSATFQLAYAPPGSGTYTNVASALVTVPSATAAGADKYVVVNPSTDAYVTDGGSLRITVGGTATGGGAPLASIVLGV